MIVSHRDLYLDALRNGGYVQGRAALNANGAFCCLGVYCDVVDPGAWSVEPGATGVFNTFAESSSYLWGEAVRSFMEEFNVPPFAIGAVLDELINMNDGGYKTFDEIADWLEDDLPSFIAFQMDATYVTA